MPIKPLIVAALLLIGAAPAADPPVGVAAVEALLQECLDAGVIVAVKDPKTGAAPRDPKLGIPRFIVPDETKLRATIRANHAVMEKVESRQSLIGCAKLAGSAFAPGWVDLLRAVGRELNDHVSVTIAYNIAAVHELPLGGRQGFQDLKTVVNAALEAGALEYHPAGSNGLAWLTVRDEAKFQALLEANRALLGPGLIGAAAQASRSRCDHTPVLKAIAALTNDPAATAHGAEFAARSYRDELRPLKVAEELELAAKHFATLDDQPSRARVLTQLGQVRRELGEEERALELFDEALDLLGRVDDGPHRQLADLHRLKAELFCERNETQRALMAYMKAIRMMSSLNSNNDQFEFLTNMMRLLARIDRRLGHDDDAREKLTDILFLLGEVERKDIPGFDTGAARALTLRDLGLLELGRGRFAAAKARLDAALEIQMRREGAVHPETIRTLFLLGQVCAAGGEPGQSEFFTREATIFLRHHYGSKHPAVVKAWSDRAAVHVARGDYRAAGAELDLGLKAARVTAGTAAPTVEDYLPSRDAVLLLARRGELSMRAADLTTDPAERLKILREARAQFALAEGVFQRVRGNMPGDEDRLLAGDDAPDFSGGLLGCLVRLGALDPNTVDPGAAFAIAERATARGLLETLGDDVASLLGGVPEVVRAEHRRLRLQMDATLREHSQLPFREDQTGPTPEQSATWERHLHAQRELGRFERRLSREYPTPARETGVAVLTAEQALKLLGPNEVAVTFLTGVRESFAVALGRGPNGPETTVRALPPRDQIEDKVATLLDPKVMDEEWGRRLGEELHDQLLAPLGDRIAGKDLVIVPTGPLCRLPFELLRAPGAEGRAYLGLTRRVRYAPSLTVLRLLRDRDRARRTQPDRALWALGDPVVASATPLRGAAKEVEAIAALLNAPPENVLVGPKATKAAVLAASSQGELRRCRIVHFAAHAGLGSEGDPLPGLALGGDANQDGRLNMDEIARLDLNADLVILSACSSGGGRIYGGEGIRGMTSAFLIAGGRAVIATHWPLEDAGAAPFMEAFHRRLQAHARPADALLETRRAAALQADPRPPSEWAAFILIGN